jgi:hypothetical protein
MNEIYRCPEFKLPATGNKVKMFARTQGLKYVLPVSLMPNEFVIFGIALIYTKDRKCYSVRS